MDPIQYTLTTYASDELTLGFQGKTCSFDWRAFKDRTPEAQKAYLKLKEDLLARGMQDPLITFRGHVLVGQRRFEILRDVQDRFPAYEVLEDVSMWTSQDLDRLEAFKKEVYTVNPERFKG